MRFFPSTQTHTLLSISVADFGTSRIVERFCEPMEGGGEPVMSGSGAGDVYKTQGEW